MFSEMGTGGGGGHDNEVMGKPRLEKKKRTRPPDEERMRGTLLAEQTAQYGEKQHSMIISSSQGNRAEVVGKRQG